MNLILKFLICNKIIHIFIFLFHFTKTECNINLDFTGETIGNIINNIKEIIQFTVNVKDNSKFNFIKIMIEGINLDSNNNHIISFYQQDSTFMERKQLSQSITNKTELILNNEQTKTIFYFEAECVIFPCNFNYTLLGMDTIILNSDESYNYYVTKETKKMIFTIRIKQKLICNNDFISNNTITIWAKGNKNITCLLNAQNYIKLSKYNAFIIQLSNISNISNINDYIFTVQGENGDLITVGSSFFDGSKNSLSSIAFEENILEISGFLKKNIKNKNCFKILQRKPSIEGLFSYNFYGNEKITIKNIISTPLKEEEEKYNLKCLTLENDAEEGFYSIQYYNKYEINSMNQFSPQLLGSDYFRYIKEGDIIELIPIKPDYEFSYLTYYIKPFKGKIIKAFIYSCHTYPKCRFYYEDKDNIVPIQNINSFSISFSKNELDKFSSSSIDKNRKVLVISCEKGSKIDTDISNEYYSSNCLISVNMYTNKDKIFVYPSIPYYRHIPKNNEEHFKIGNKTTSPIRYINLNIEVIVGDITINILDTKNYNIYKYKNKYLYKVSEEEFTLKIKAKSSSFYTINYKTIYKRKERISIHSNYNYLIGGDYLLNMEKTLNLTIILSNIFTLLNDSISSPNQNPIYIGFYPLNCKIDVYNNLYTDNEFKQIKLKEMQGFYQEIFSINEKNSSTFNYTISHRNKNENCSFYISAFELNKQVMNSSDSIILSYDFPKNFKFSPKYNIFKFTYPHIKNGEDVQIKFGLMTEGKYLMKLFFNDKISNNEYIIQKNDSVIIKSNNLENKCKNGDICKISFNIELINKEKDTVLQIRILSDANNKALFIILICIGSVIFLIVVALVIYLIIYKFKNKKLIDNIKAISFINNDDKDRRIIENEKDEDDYFLY